ncbi:unnamed protein product [Coffea canephora]|uniref:Uncharacterized protein n=1 Tax=Coffea canephora TaxID=49390 RepID=A0A068TS55_COFCA|nr:unnamed protein product [Coffea canephora]
MLVNVGSLLAKGKANFHVRLSGQAGITSQLIPVHITAFSVACWYVELTDMAAVASAAAPLVLKSCSPASKNPPPNAIRIAFAKPNTCSPKISKTRAGLVRALESEREEANSDKDGPDDIASLFQEDLNYLIQLGAGSVVGAAAIKYGSAVFPEITRPNIIEALALISFPLIAAVLLLIRQSRSQ